MSINVVGKIDELVKVRHILVSVSDKSGLAAFIPSLLDINPALKILSTGLETSYGIWCNAAVCSWTC